MADRKCERTVVFPEPDSPLRKYQCPPLSGNIAGSLQKDDSLIFGASTESRPSPICHFLGSSHCASLLPAIWTRGGGRVSIERDESVGRQLCSWQRDVKS